MVLTPRPCAPRHPARLTGHRRLYDGAVLTATECAERAGVTPSAMTHLRALERPGSSSRAEPAATGRERPWKRAGGARRRAQGEEATPAGLAAAELLIANSLDLDRQRLLESIRADARRPKRARGAARTTPATPSCSRLRAQGPRGRRRQPSRAYRRANRGDLPEGTSAYRRVFILAQDPDPA